MCCDVLRLLLYCGSSMSQVASSSTLLTQVNEAERIIDLGGGLGEMCFNLNYSNCKTNASSRVATNVEISTKRGKTKIFLTNVEKTWISMISMKKSWKFETRVK